MGYYSQGISVGGVSSPAKPVLRQGSKGAFVMEVQTKLGMPVDGTFGPKTLAAVKSYQSSHGLAADGVVGPLTWAALDGSGVPTPVPVTLPDSPDARPVVAKGASGANVIDLQHRLGITTDGLFGPGTAAAVKSFQSEHGLEVDGVVGPQTWAALSEHAPATTTTPGAKAVITSPPIRTPEAVTIPAPPPPTPSAPPARQKSSSGNGIWLGLAAALAGGGILLLTGKKKGI